LAGRVLDAHGGDSELSDLELHLIDLLQEDGRTPYVDLARLSGATEKTVRRKVRTLIDEGIIRISAVTDPVLLGYACMGLACIRTTAGTRTSDVADRLAEIDSVDYVTCTTGRFAVQAEVVCKDPVALEEIVQQSIRTLPGVEDVEFLIYLRLHFQEPWFGRRAAMPGRGVRPKAFDSTDQELILGLADDGRRTFRSLAAEMGVSETLVRQRFQSMTDDAALKVLAVANPLRLGYHAVSWVLISLTPGASAVAVAEDLSKMKSVTYVAITAGRFDILTEVVCRDREELLELLDQGIRANPGIGATELLLYTDLRYKSLRPLSLS